MVLAATALVNVGCTDDFLKQDPLSFYNPENTYTTESGLQSALSMCDYGLKEMLMSELSYWQNHLAYHPHRFSHTDQYPV